MKQVLFLFAMASLALSACSEQSVEEQSVTNNESNVEERSVANREGSDEDAFFTLLEARISDLEALAEEDSVCMSRMMEVNETDQQRLTELAEKMEEKYGSDVPPDLQARADQIDARAEAVDMKLRPKIQMGC